DRRVERAHRRAVLLLAIPPAIAHLLTEEPVHDVLDVLTEVGADGCGLAVDARLHLAREKGLAVVLPLDVLAHEPDGPARSVACRIETELPQQHQAPCRRGPFREERAAPLRRHRSPPLFARLGLELRGAAIPLPVLALEGEQPSAPTFFGDAGALG